MAQKRPSGTLWFLVSTDRKPLGVKNQDLPPEKGDIIHFGGKKYSVTECSRVTRVVVLTVHVDPEPKKKNSGRGRKKPKSARL